MLDKLKAIANRPLFTVKLWYLVVAITVTLVLLGLAAEGPPVE